MWGRGGNSAGCGSDLGVLLACTTHALTTESEEVMGLLLGNIRVGLAVGQCPMLHCISLSLSLTLRYF